MPLESCRTLPNKSRFGSKLALTSSQMLSRLRKFPRGGEKGKTERKIVAFTAGSVTVAFSPYAARAARAREVNRVRVPAIRAASICDP